MDETTDKSIVPIKHRCYSKSHSMELYDRFCYNDKTLCKYDTQKSQQTVRVSITGTSTGSADRNPSSQNAITQVPTSGHGGCNDAILRITGDPDITVNSTQTWLNKQRLRNV